jgi:hypothetical protein|tara:strand:+ start:1574 stop:1777 length:204 start_codon:yes stop_codon:yes gene_type:complete
MKIFSFLFRPQYLIRELQKENNSLKMRVAELTDENQSLWDMLDEIKAADEEAMNYSSLLNTETIGEA